MRAIVSLAWEVIIVTPWERPSLTQASITLELANAPHATIASQVNGVF